MTALTARPSRTAANFDARTRQTEDRRLLALALLSAGLLHALVLLAPVPDKRRTTIPEPPRQPPSLVPLDIPPPPLEPPTRRVSAPTERLLPVPDERPDDPEPVAEPRLEPDAAPAIPTDHGWGPYEPAAPPPTLVGEETPGLILPRPLDGRVQPEFPRLAVSARIGGSVVLRAVITRDGRVESIEVIEASQPDLGFSQAAVEAVSAWRYEPGILDGRPVAVVLTVVVTFELR